MEKLGIHAFVWTGNCSQEHLVKAVETSHDLGYTLIELPKVDLKLLDVPALSKLLQARNMGIIVTMGLPKDGDIACDDPQAIAKGEAILREAVSLARDLGAKKLGGIIFSAHGKYQTKPTESGWKNSVEVIQKVADAGTSAGVSINLEIVNRFESNLLNTAAQGLKFVEDTGSDNVFIHLDTFHMNIEEASPAGAIRSAGSKLGYFHIGESNRGYLGAGTVNFDEIFDALVDIDYDDYITFESFSSKVVDEELSVVAAIWRNTWTDNVAVARHAKAFIDERYASALRRRQITITP